MICTGTVPTYDLIGGLPVCNYRKVFGFDKDRIDVISAPTGIGVATKVPRGDRVAGLDLEVIPTHRIHLFVCHN